MRSAARAIMIALLPTLIVAVVGCDSLDGRSKNRKGNAAFREMRFVDAVAYYQQAIKEVDDPIVHYNLALAYSKVFKPGGEGDVLIDRMGTDACNAIPGVKSVSKQVCVKEGDRHFLECDPKADPKKNEDRDKICASSFTCQKIDICALDDTKLADLVTEHFSQWLKSHPTDAETRALMTQVWIDSSQYQKALDYWEELLKAKPNDPEIMGNLAGINLKANEWRKSIEWYIKVANVATEASAKVAAYQFIGNVAWSKLNSKTLTQAESVELADRGIGALQKAGELQPDNPRPFGLMASIFNFRAQAQGASWASALDRATAQDLQHTSRVLNEKAKKAAGTAPPTVPGGAATNPTPGKTGG
jgi:tetratricopeptide (TPR) repeat protein